jgi:hypothetical protein
MNSNETEYKNNTEDQSLTIKEYKDILKFYKIKIPKKHSLIKKEAENVIADKLCRCIKTFSVKEESKSIPICTKSILKKKGFTRGNFSCKNKKFVHFKRIRNTRKKNTM